VKPKLPTRRILQLNFPRRNVQQRTSVSPRQRNSARPAI
jgi:hypothetical protein